MIWKLVYWSLANKSKAFVAKSKNYCQGDILKGKPSTC
jgi:hypothetical protein